MVTNCQEIMLPIRSSKYSSFEINARRAAFTILLFSIILAFSDAFQTSAPKFSKSLLNNRRSRLQATEAEGDDDADLLSSLQSSFDYEGRILSPDEDFRSGFVSFIGAANMGKSTLMNALLEENLCTATHRPQTTRHSILGVLTSEEQKVQICFMDTPGVIEDPSYKLQEGMMEAVQGAFKSADAILVVTDLFSTPIPNDELFLKLNLSDKNKIVVINKIDLADKVNVDADSPKQFYNADDEDSDQLYERTVTIEAAVNNWRKLVPDATAIIPLTASGGPENVGVKALRSLLFGGPDVPAALRDLGRPINGMFKPGVKMLDNEQAMEIIPVCPPLYDPDTLTDRTERFFVSEIIRATLFCTLGKELPYCCEVRIDEFKEPNPADKRPLTRIRASIHVERTSQLGIVVGKNGAKIKEVGIDAREKIEEFLQEKVFLNLEVKVDKNWRTDEKKLKAYGYLK